MRVVLVVGSAGGEDARSKALLHTLQRAGHETLIWSPVRKIGNKRPPKADLYQPTSPRFVDAARQAAIRHRGLVVRRPDWPSVAPVDVIDHAPHQAQQPFPSIQKAPDQHHILICYRRTAYNPGRYLQAGLERMGVKVTHAEALDWDALEPTATGVVIVESPLPELQIRGTNPGIPVAFWVHHGEHHLDVNLRLQLRYRAHTVLLAHSWHLAHRFVGRVARLPFAVAPEINSPPIPWSDRQWDVGFVGSLTEPGGRYGRRAQMLADLASELGEDRIKVVQGVSPEEQAAIYANSRIVLNDGGTRHLPITMRTFEALAAGALLLTDPMPGLDTLLTPGTHYAEIDGAPIGEQARRWLASDGKVAEAGYEEARTSHTYDHRALTVLSVLESTPLTQLPAVARPKGVAGLVDDTVDLQRVLAPRHLELGEQLPDREVWDYEVAAERAEPGTFDVAVLGGPLPTETLDRMIRAARKSVVITPSSPKTIKERVFGIHPDAIFEDHEDGTVVSFGTSGYRLTR